MTDPPIEEPQYSHPELEPEPEKRLMHPILRLILYALAYMAVNFAVAVETVVVAAIIKLQATNTLAHYSIAAVLMAPAVLFITYLFVVYLDNRPFSTLGLNTKGSWAAEVAFGAILPVAIISLLFVITYCAKWIRITGTLFEQSPVSIAGVILGTVVLMIAIAIGEEVVIRGYVLQTIESAYGKAAAVIISSVIFSSLHFLNPGAGIISWIGVTSAGFVFAYAYLATRRLWLPIAMHFGWNFTLGPIYGFRVSGMSIPSWIEQYTTGPRWWLGGLFGPEAGVWVIVSLLLMTLGIWWFSKRFYRPENNTLQP